VFCNEVLVCDESVPGFAESVSPSLQAIRWPSSTSGFCVAWLEEADGSQSQPRLDTVCSMNEV